MAGLMGAGSRRRQTAILPPQKFHCLLDELPLHLIPQSISNRQSRLATAQPLFLDPSCLLLPPGEIPREFESKRDVLNGFYLRSSIAWVRDPAAGTLNPFWVGPELAETLAGLRPGDAAPDSLSQKARFTLLTAGILRGANDEERRSHEWKARVGANAREFSAKNYTPMAGLIHPFHLAALRRYYRHQIRSGAIWLGDEQSSRRYVAHNEPVARFFHHQLADVVGQIVGEPVKPSYVYLGSYLSGAELKKHTDREQCEFSVTLCLDFSPEPEVSTSWPIRLDTADGSVAVYQPLGDGLVYRGTKVPHYRTPLSEGHTSTSIFFHYVANGFSGALD
jgi:hypothetical protein